MQQDTSRIQIKTNQLDIIASNLSPEEIQSVLDFAIMSQKNQMRQESKANFQSLLIGIFLAVILGLGIYTFQTVQINNQESSITDVE